MAINYSSPWHRASYDAFVNERLPQLLASRLPLAGYSVDQSADYTCRINVTFVGDSGDVVLDYAIPQPDEDGIFNLNDYGGGPLWTKTVVPTASSEDLDTAEIKCVGEQLYDYFNERLADAPEGLPWDETLARKLVPIDAWALEFINTEGAAQFLDRTDWLSTRTHLRRIRIPKREKLIAPGQFGRVCPFDTPEGPNIGHVFSVAVGAEIRDGKLVVVDDSPEAGLGLIASIVPFLEHNDPVHALMGVNMMRQWMTPVEPEPALVQTGNEPDVDGFWCGRNLLTAFVSWGPDTYEDAILVSESCAKRFCNPLRDAMGYEWPEGPVEPGDKVSNRHGAKGVISRVVPDDEMPHLADGTPVELVYNFIGIHTRLHFGQVREALISRIAKAEGQPAIVPPFHAPSEDELRERMKKAGLSEDGMETLTLGKGGKKLNRPGMVGWVYWGRTSHWAMAKMHASVRGDRCMRQGEMEYQMLRDLGAYETIAEEFNTRAVRRNDADTLAARVAAGPVQQAAPPTPAFSDLAKRLAAAGVRIELDGEKLAFRFAPPEGDKLELARPIPHPWLRERTMTEIGIFDGQIARISPPVDPTDLFLPTMPQDALTSPEWTTLVQTNDRLKRMLSAGAPENLTEKASADLEQRVKDFLDALLTRRNLLVGDQIVFSGKSVLAPGIDLRTDQVGLAEDMAWTLFGPLVTRELGDESEVEKRAPRAAKILDEIMARSWLIVTRAPAFMPTSILAFHPVRDPGDVIRLHPLVCVPMNADYDGDQAAVFVPITEEGQREAGELLSLAAHLRRDPALIKWLYPNHEMLFGLALLSLTPKGLDEISELAGAPVAAPQGFMTRDSVTDALRAVLERDGAEAALETAERLMRRGFEVTKESGASISPFIGVTLDCPPEPTGDDAESWNAYAEELAEALASRSDFANSDIGPQLLAVKCGARGSIHSLASLVGARGAVTDVHGKAVPIRHGYRDGLTFEETCARVVGAREGLGRTAEECMGIGYGVRQTSRSGAFTALARATRSERPGVVFARAAAAGEVDPLVDLDSRLFVGLRVARRGQ